MSGSTISNHLLNQDGFSHQVMHSAWTCAGRVAEVERLIAEAQHGHENEATRHA